MRRKEGFMCKRIMVIDVAEKETREDGSGDGWTASSPT